MFRREYLSTVVNVLTNSVKISDPTLADFIPTQFISNSRDNMLIGGAELISAVFGTG